MPTAGEVLRRRAMRQWACHAYPTEPVFPPASILNAMRIAALALLLAA